MTLPQAVDAERFDDQGIQQAQHRGRPLLARRPRPADGRGLHPLQTGEYGVVPRMQLAGLAPGPAGLATAVSDSRSDRGALAVPMAAPPSTGKPVQ